MTTRHAQIILTILHEGSFTAAARALFITQPTLSQTVKQIETQLGEPIFVRGRTPLELTPAGELYAQAARRILQIETQLGEAISLLHGHAEGTLHLGLCAHRAGELLPQVLPDYMAAYPSVRIEITEGSRQELEQRLLRRELDMAFLTGDAQQAQLDYRLIASEEVVLLAGRRTALAQRIPSGSTISLSEAQDERFVLPTERAPCRLCFDGLFSAYGFSPRVALVCDSAHAAKRACSGCDLVMLSPFITLLSDSAQMQKLAHYHLSMDAFLPPYYMVCPREQALAPYAEALFTLMSNRFRAMTAYRE